MFLKARKSILFHGTEGDTIVLPGEEVEVDETTAKKLLEAGVAVETPRLPAQKPIPAASDPIPNENPSEDAKAEEPAKFAEPEGDPKYSTAMSVTALRAAMKENGFTVRVNMTKKEMVDTLNGSVPPVLDAQDVVDE